MSIIRLFFFTGLFFLLAWTCPALANDEAGKIVDKMQAQYESLSGFQSNFVQKLKYASSGESEDRAGKLYFNKPSLIRWETETPVKELLVAGEKLVWDFFPEEGVAYKYPVEEILDSKTMLRFISGQARLDKDFMVKIASKEEELVKLDLVPKEPEPQLVQAFAWVSPKTGLLHKVLLKDFYGNENELSFVDLELNPKLDSELFEFTPPADVEIMDNTQK